MGFFDKTLFETLGELTPSAVAQFATAFELHFGRHCFVAQPPGALNAAIAVRKNWPETEKSRMREYFKGWRDRQIALNTPAMPPAAPSQPRPV